MFWKKKDKPPKPKVEKAEDGTEKYFAKLVLMGDGAVGKTSIRRRYLGMGFTADHLMTIGADFAATDKTFTFKTKSGEEKTFNITFQIWDLAGQANFSTVRSMYYKGCFGALLVFDRTRPSSFQNITHWLNEMQKHNGKGNIPLVLLGNKADLVPEAKEVVSQDQIDELLTMINDKYGSDKFTIKYFDTSALTGKNIEEAFETLAYNIMSWLNTLN